MENKKVSSINLTTLLLIIIVAIIALIVGFFIIKARDFAPPKEESQVSRREVLLEEKKAELNSSIEEYSKQHSNRQVSNNSSDNSNYLDFDEFFKLLLDRNYYYTITSATINGDKILVEADYGKTYEMPEKDYTLMKTNGTITINDITYTFANDSSPYNQGNGYIKQQDNPSNYYTVTQNSLLNYYFRRDLGNTYVELNRINNHYSFKLDKTTKVKIRSSGTETTLEQYISSDANKDFNSCTATIGLQNVDDNGRQEIVITIN